MRRNPVGGLAREAKRIAQQESKGVDARGRGNVDAGSQVDAGVVESNSGVVRPYGLLDVTQFGDPFYLAP